MKIFAKFYDKVTACYRNLFSNFVQFFPHFAYVNHRQIFIE